MAWMILAYKTKLEVMVIQQLMERGVEFYRPMTQKKTRIRNVRMVVSAPLYPGYMFVRPHGETIDERVYAVEGLIGKQAIFMHGVTDELIAKHRQEEVDGFIRCMASPKQTAHMVRVGDKVRTIDGLMDFVVHEVLPDNRIAALMRFMGGSDRRVVVDLANVTKLPDEPEPGDAKGKPKGRGKKKKR